MIEILSNFNDSLHLLGVGVLDYVYTLVVIIMLILSYFVGLLAELKNTVIYAFSIVLAVILERPLSLVLMSPFPNMKESVVSLVSIVTLFVLAATALAYLISTIPANSPSYRASFGNKDGIAACLVCAVKIFAFSMIVVFVLKRSLDYSMYEYLTLHSSILRHIDIIL